MLESAHALTGAVIAYKIGNPLLALPLALLSHFLTDLLPHWNPEIYQEKKKRGSLSLKTTAFIVLDCLIGLFLGSFLAFKALETKKAVLVLAGSLLAILPDLAEAPFYFLGIKNKYLNRLLKFQGNHQWKASFWPGMIFQLWWVAFLLIISFKR